ncbi:MAG TPA: methylenetetrahydrofolate reductase [Vicinamibacterales bacterium]|nr:methylenetetrahydrofolate reductase [Vicinamibacterales bacterium]
MMRFSDACGAEIPRWIRLRLQSFGDDTASIKAFGLDVVTDLCEQLRAGGAPAIHFYTMNQSGPTLPERGVALKAELRRFFDVPGVRQAGSLVAADTDHLWSANGTASVFRPAGRRGKLFARASGGWSFGETALVNGFSLGGPFELGAYFPNELRGSNCAVANLGYFQEIGRFVEGAIGRLHAGAWIERGAAFERLRSADFRTNVSAGLLLESPIGPVFAGVSLGEHGRYRVFFSLGRFLPH